MSVAESTVVVAIALVISLLGLTIADETPESHHNVTHVVGNRTRESRGLLETIQGVVQTVQTVNKLFGSGNSGNNNKENYYTNQYGQPGGNGYGNPAGNGGIDNYASLHNYHAAQQLQGTSAVAGASLYPNYNIGVVQHQQQQGNYHQTNPGLTATNNNYNNNYYGGTVSGPLTDSGTYPGVANGNQYYPAIHHQQQQQQGLLPSGAGMEAAGGISKQGFIPGSNSVLSGGSSSFTGSGAFGNVGGGLPVGGFGNVVQGGTFPGAINPGFAGANPGLTNPTFGAAAGAGGFPGALNPGFGGAIPGSNFGSNRPASSALASLLNSGGSGLGGVGALASLLGGASSLLGAGAGNSVSSGTPSSSLLSGLNELGILDDLSDVLSFRNFEKLVGNVNKFDSLKCIPRMVCETIAKRQQDALEKDSREGATTTTTTTRRPKYRARKMGGSAGEDRAGRFIPGLKIQGVDTALEQFVKFLELTQLKDWAMYPYLQGAYYGHQVRRSAECADKFSSCPFTEEQLLYYFNNYKGGLFQHFGGAESSGSNIN